MPSKRRSPTPPLPQTAQHSGARRAETLVAETLTARGWTIIARNLRVSHDEIDIVAWHGQTLVLVEVKARRPGAMVDPLSAVTLAKRTRLRRAALALVQQHSALDVRIDVAAVVGSSIDFIENAVDFSEV